MRKNEYTVLVEKSQINSPLGSPRHKGKILLKYKIILKEIGCECVDWTH
jgi:hypothetical protein